MNIISYISWTGSCGFHFQCKNNNSGASCHTFICHLFSPAAATYSCPHAPPRRTRQKYQRQRHEDAPILTLVTPRPHPAGLQLPRAFAGRVSGSDVDAATDDTESVEHTSSAVGTTNEGTCSVFIVDICCGSLSDNNALCAVLVLCVLWRCGGYRLIEDAESCQPTQIPTGSNVTPRHPGHPERVFFRECF